jgi:hypothetical protein
MTLVVGSIDAGGVRLVADTRLSRERNPADFSDVFHGALKIIVLHPNLAVALAGDAEAATDAILTLPVSAGSPFDRNRVCTTLRRRSALVSAEFLLAFADPAELVHISGGIVRCGRAVEHLGQGFGKYQAHFHAPENAAITNDLSSMMLRAMIEVVTSGAVPAVGGSAIAVHTTWSGLNYYGGQSVVFGPAEAEVDPLSHQVNITTTLSAATGSFTETILGPSMSGTAALGIHIAELDRGAMFAPVVFGSAVPLQVHGCTATQFRDRMSRDYGLELVLPPGDTAVLW